MTYPAPPTAPITDLELMAHADGELPPSRAAEVEQAVRTDSALAARSAMYRRTRELAHAVYDEALNEPVPPALLASVRRAAAAGRRPESSAVAVDPARIAPAANAPRYLLVASIAALAAGVIGFMLGGRADGVPADTLAAAPGPSWALPGPSSGEAGGLVTQALSRQASGAGQRLADGAMLVVMASYRDAAGRLCREFGWAAPPTAPAPIGQAAEGLACHEGAASGAWQLTALVQTAPPGDGGFRPAGNGALDAVAKRLAVGPALSEADEAKALEELGRRR